MKICYINFNLDNPRDQITLRGLRENGITVKEIADSAPGWRKYARIARACRACQREYDTIVVGYAGSALVIFMRLLTRKKMVYNALSTFYDSMIVSRGNGALLSPSTLWYYLLDYLAFRCATRSFLECQSQKDLATRIFRINPNDISVHFVGTDDTQFYFDPAILKASQFTVVFRGMFLPEAGVDVAIRAAKELEGEGVTIRIIGRGLLKARMETLVRELRPSNVELITDVLPSYILRKNMLECHLSLGQLADHPRVHTTVPHKLFESMAMKLPYLTGENVGILEVVRDNQTCFTVPPGNYRLLARKIAELKRSPKELERVAENAYQLYLRDFTPKILAQKMMRDIES